MLRVHTREVVIATVLIAGGGIGRLTLVASLRHHGLRATVYKRASSLAPVGAGITIQLNAVLVLRTAGLDEDVLREGHAPTQSRVLDARGRPLTVIDLAVVARSVGASAMGLHRARLMAALRRRLDDDAVHLGRRGRRVAVERACAAPRRRGAHLCGLHVVEGRREGSTRR